MGGQNAVTATGEVVGKGDLGAQTEQVVRSLETALRATGADFDHPVKWTISVSTASR